MRRAVLSLALLIATTSSATAQTSRLDLEVGGSRVLPPVGVDGDAAGFLIGGIRASRYGVEGSGGYASFLLGRSFDAATGGDFLSGEVGGALRHAWSPHWSAGLEGRAFGFRVRAPFSYQAGAAEGSATLRYRHGLLTTSIGATGGAGRSRVTLTPEVLRMRRMVTTTEILDDDLWRWGGTFEVLAGGSVLAAGLAGEAHRSAGGSYGSVGARIVSGGSHGAIEIRADRWHTPAGSQTTGGIAFYVPWGGWNVRGGASRPEPDPLLLAEPGRGAGGLLLGRTLLRGATSRAGPSLYRTLPLDDDGTARVRFSVEAPPGTSSVALMGDFSLWEPVAMSADGRRWTVELPVPPGTYHFGFLVDGSWYLPDDAPDAVPDEWGRRSATLVVEGEDRSRDSGTAEPRGAIR